MAIEAVKIPQNVYVEDRIIGPVTLKQLIICGIATGISYALYATVTKASGSVSLPVTILLWTPAVIGFAFAFLKINDLSLFNIILLMIEKINKPATRTWSPYPGISINIITRARMDGEQAPTHRQAESMDHITALTRQVQEREAALAELANHTQDSATSAGGSQQKTSVDTAHELVAMDAPVDPEAIDVGGLDPTKSIDGIASSDLSRFSHLFTQ